MNRLNGSVFDDDPVWGNGFGGSASVQMAKMFNASADVRFGCRDTFRYWYVKGDVTLNEATAIPIGPVGIYGFIGGAYQHMTPTTRRSGEVVTDIGFEPTPDNIFGIMAGVHLGVLGSPSSFHAKILLSARFLDANLVDLDLDGKGWFMCDLNRECNDADDSWAQIHMNMDFEEDRFHAIIMANISLLPLLSINAPEGSVDILFEPENWHVYIGRGPFSDPERSTVTAHLLPDVIDITAEGYAMIGNNIAVNVGGINLVGGGFATGIKVEFHAGGTFLIFYGQVDGLFQAELAIIHLDEASRGCISGAGGWYALANVRIELGLEVGIDVDLWLISGRFEIFAAEIGMDVLVGGPGPTFLDGDARGSFEILDGLVSGSFHYHFHLGDDVPRECLAAAADRFAMPEPIVSISPNENEHNVSVFSSIGLGFAMKEGVVAALARSNQDSLRIRFRLLQPVRVQDEGGETVSGTLTFSTDKLSAEWATDDVLKADTMYTIIATAVGEVFRDGAWQETRRQVKTSSFRTGPRPRFIADPRLVDFQYPLNRQRYSYIRGHENKHYAHFSRNMNYLFTNLAPGQSLVAEYTDENLRKTTKPIIYESYSGGCGGFAKIENLDLRPNARYHLRLIKRTNTDFGREFPIGPPGFRGLDPHNYELLSARYLSRARDLAIRAGGRSEDFSTALGTTLIERRQGSAQSRVIRHGAIIDTILYDWFFGTGQYNTASEKFSAATVTYNSRWGESSFLTFSVSMPEPIDDDLTALTFIRDPSRTPDRTARGWLNVVKRNDDLARDYSTLVNLIGESDAAVVRNYVITTDSRLRSTPGYTYFDATAPWQFSRVNHARYQLSDYELEFEEIPPAEHGGFRFDFGIPGLGLPGGVGGGRGGIGGFGIPERPDGYSESVVTLPFNASGDLTNMTWRYRGCLNRVIRVRPERVRVLDMISRASRDSITAVGARTWTNIPNGRYAVGLVQKTIKWQMQSIWSERGYSPHGRRVLEADRLELISIFGDPTHISFGEFSCGDPGTVPFRRIFLEVR